jgi:aminopeptidase-like protein|tara:strand:+ start:769 stop:906 length:138 start_codon:yes stop_codon:yes gene_type:complete
VKKYYRLTKHFLFPICRSLTGDGVRKNLKIIKAVKPLISEAEKMI